jgi:lactate dehydrogenase-like 2-hydroxyacid dehydrogenase
MKITIFVPQSDFKSEQQKALSGLGQVVYTASSEELPGTKLIELSNGSTVIAPDPDVFGGFEKASPLLTKVMESLPDLKGVCLSTTSFGWIDLNYCKKRGITVSNVPVYSGESVAEHTLALLLCLAKKIIITDRRTQKNAYKLEIGFELKGKTLGIVGLGNIGSRVADLGLGIGMKVIAYNRSPKTKEGVAMKTLDEVLKEADAISLHTTHEENNKRIIGREQITKMKDGLIIVNTVDRELVDEEAMAEALKSGKVYGYAYEGEDLLNTPLAKVENAIGLKGFGWYTKEAMANLYKIWTDNIVTMAKGSPQNRVA